MPMTTVTGRSPALRCARCLYQQVTKALHALGYHSIGMSDGGMVVLHDSTCGRKEVHSEKPTLRHSSRYRDASAPPLDTMISTRAPFLASPCVSPKGSFMTERLPQQAYPDDHVAITGPCPQEPSHSPRVGQGCRPCALGTWTQEWCTASFLPADPATTCYYPAHTEAPRMTPLAEDAQRQEDEAP